MTEPKRSPKTVTLEAGTHFWCQCGFSEKQPFCDGSHNGTPFVTLAFTLEEPKTVTLCQCLQTKTPPYCDGSHKSLQTPS